jgi:hypothetical protein
VTKEACIAYCAGLIDGEGCIRIKRTEWALYRADRKTPGFHASIQVKMVNKNAVDFLAECLSGRVRLEKQQQPNRRPLYVWSITDQKAEDACILLLPYLRVKTRQAELILRLRSQQRQRSSHMTKVIGTRQFPNEHGTIRIIETKCLSDEYIAGLQTIYEESRRLNAVGDAAIP